MRRHSNVRMEPLGYFFSISEIMVLRRGITKELTEFLKSNKREGRVRSNKMVYVYVLAIKNYKMKNCFSVYIKFDAKYFIFG